MAQRYDKLGRRIAQFDRSAVARENAARLKERYGDDHFKRIGTTGGKVRGRGHFGKLKDEGRTQELSNVIQKGIATRKAAKKPKSTRAQDGVRGAN